MGQKKVDDRLGLNIELLSSSPGRRCRSRCAATATTACEVPFETVPAEEVRAAEHRFDSVGVVVADITPAFVLAYGLDDKTKGVVITKVLPGSIAERYQLAAGDVVLTLAGVRVQNTESLSLLIRAL